MNIKGLNFSQLKEGIPYVIWGCLNNTKDQGKFYNICHVIKKEKNKAFLEVLTDSSFVIIPTVKDVEKTQETQFKTSFQYVLEEELIKGIWKIFPVNKNVFLKVVEIHKSMLMEQLKPLVENMKSFTKLYSKFK